MIDTNKLLGGLLGNAMGKDKLGSGMGGKAAVGMGILGVAMAAAEHFMGQKSTQDPQPPHYPPNSYGQQGRHAPPPLPPQAPPQTSPAPPSGAQAPSMAPPPPPSASASEQDTGTLLIRAMIAAAHADGVLDAEEMQRILGRLQALDLSAEEQSFLLREMQQPKTPEDLASAVGTPELARQVYAVSLLAVDVDTPEEEAYMLRLQQLLGLDHDAVEAVRKDLTQA